MNKRKGGKDKAENAVNSVAEIPLIIIQAMAVLLRAEKERYAETIDRMEYVSQARELLDSAMAFIAGGDCNLGKLALTDSQQEYLRFVFEQFAKGEEIEFDAPNPTVVSMV